MKIVVALSLTLVAAALAEDALPQHSIRRAAGPIAVDGHLDEPSWGTAQVIDQFAFPWWTEGAKDSTQARLLWDDVHLYVAFTAHDPHISATLTERDSPVSRDDCVEVFIAPDTSRVTSYFNFEFNALGTILDRSPHAERSAAWNGAGVQVAIDIAGTLNDETDQDTLWTAEIALPFAVFAQYAPRLPPAAGDVWRLNLYRTGGAVNLQYSAWSNTLTPQPQFHVPQHFGVVHFDGRAVLGRELK